SVTENCLNICVSFGVLGDLDELVTVDDFIVDNNLLVVVVEVVVIVVVIVVVVIVAVAVVAIVVVVIVVVVMVVVLNEFINRRIFLDFAISSGVSPLAFLMLNEAPFLINS